MYKLLFIIEHFTLGLYQKQGRSIPSKSFITSSLSYIKNQRRIHILSQSNRSAIIGLMIVRSNLRIAISIAVTSWSHALNLIMFLQLLIGNNQGGYLCTGRTERHSILLTGMTNGLKSIYRWFCVSLLALGIHGTTTQWPWNVKTKATDVILLRFSRSFSSFRNKSRRRNK